MKEVKNWITIKGVHIPIYAGETKQQVYNRFTKQKSKANSNNIEKTVNTIIQKGKELDDMFEDKKSYKNSPDRGQSIANEFYSKLGYNKKPEVVSKEEYDKQLKSNKLGELARGIQATDEQMTTYLKQYKEGDLQTSTSVNSMFGRGIYFGVGNDAESIASNYGNHIMKCMLKNNSKVITTDELSTKRKEILDIIEKRRDEGVKQAFDSNNKDLYTTSMDMYKKSMPLIADNGYLAATLGYDAVIEKGQGVLVILNRGKMVFKDE